MYSIISEFGSFQDERETEFTLICQGREREERVSSPEHLCLKVPWHLNSTFPMQNASSSIPLTCDGVHLSQTVGIPSLLLILDQPTQAHNQQLSKWLLHQLQMSSQTPCYYSHPTGLGISGLISLCRTLPIWLYLVSVFASWTSTSLLILDSSMSLTNWPFLSHAILEENSLDKSG